MDSIESFIVGTASTFIGGLLLLILTRRNFAKKHRGRIFRLLLVLLIGISCILPIYFGLLSLKWFNGFSIPNWQLTFFVVLFQLTFGYALYGFLRSDQAKLWRNRRKVIPSIEDRIESSRSSLFFVGFSFESTFIHYGQALSRVLINNANLQIKILLLHPDSPHTVAHNEFADRNVVGKIREVINDHIKPFYDDLSKSAKNRLVIRATNYLPRFAVRVFDDETMLVNFYLYKSRAQENPVVEVSRESHKDAFRILSKSLDDLWNYKGNLPIIENGEWKWEENP